MHKKPNALQSGIETLVVYCDFHCIPMIYNLTCLEFIDEIEIKRQVFTNRVWYFKLDCC